MEKIDLLGIRINTVTLDELFLNVLYFITSKKKKKIMYANIHVINSAYNDNRLKKCLNDSDIVYCDGDGIRLGAYLSGSAIKERMTGADWIYDLCRVISDKGYSIYFLGGTVTIAEQARAILVKRYDRLKISGVHHGYFNFSGEENRKVINEINSKKPDIVLVGFGTPLQEIWIDENRDALEAPVIWSVGAVMDFVSRSVPRAPLFFRKYHMEWLYRLYQEPARMWRRYILGNILFVLRVIIFRIKCV